MYWHGYITIFFRFLYQIDVYIRLSMIFIRSRVQLGCGITIINHSTRCDSGRHNVAFRQSSGFSDGCGPESHMIFHFMIEIIMLMYYTFSLLTCTFLIGRNLRVSRIKEKVC